MIQPIEYTGTIEPGNAYLNMPNEVYHAADGISNSGLSLISRSPAHYMHAAKREASRAMEIGTAIHCALLEPARFKEEYLLLRDVKDRRASAYKEAVKQFTSERVLVSSEAVNIASMQESVYAQPEARKALESEGWREISMFATCPDTGVLMKCRFDLLTADGRAYDVKKTRDARPVQFGKSVNDYRYHVQQAFYSRVFDLVTGEPLQAFKFIAVEDQPPYTAAVYSLDELTVEIGRFLMQRDFATYASCVESGEWPHPDTATEITVPAWAVFEYEAMLEEAIV